MRTENEIFREYLVHHLTELQQADPKFSLRVFARTLKTNPGTLSSFLNGKRKLSLKLINRFCDNLDLPHEERERIFYSKNKPTRAKILEQSGYNSLSKWYYDAFIELTHIKSFRSDLKWIGKKLGINQLKVKTMIANLRQVGRLTTKDGNFALSDKETDVYAHVNTTAALKNFQLDANNLSRIALQNDDITERYHSVKTVAIDAKKIDEAKKYLREFRDRFCIDITETSEDINSIYQLNLSFYRLDKKEEEVS